MKFDPARSTHLRFVNKLIFIFFFFLPSLSWAFSSDGEGENHPLPLWHQVAMTLFNKDLTHLNELLKNQVTEQKPLANAPAELTFLAYKIWIDVACQQSQALPEWKKAITLIFQLGADPTKTFSTKSLPFEMINSHFTAIDQILYTLLKRLEWPSQKDPKDSSSLLLRAPETSEDVKSITITSTIEFFTMLYEGHHLDQSYQALMPQISGPYPWRREHLPLWILDIQSSLAIHLPNQLVQYFMSKTSPTSSLSRGWNMAMWIALMGDVQQLKNLVDSWSDESKTNELKTFEAFNFRSHLDPPMSPLQVAVESLYYRIKASYLLLGDQLHLIKSVSPPHQQVIEIIEYITQNGGWVTTEQQEKSPFDEIIRRMEFSFANTLAIEAQNNNHQDNHGQNQERQEQIYNLWRDLISKEFSELHDFLINNEERLEAQAQARQRKLFPTTSNNDDPDCYGILH